MKQIISNSIDNIVSVMVADNLTTEQKMSLLEVMGTLQGFLILEDRWDKMYDKQAALDKLNTEPGEIENGAAANAITLKP